MSSVLRYTKEANNNKNQYMVMPYEGLPSDPYRYFFTCQNNSIYRIENDLKGLSWVVARDMGAQMRIDTIDDEIKEIWSNNNYWTNIRVVKPGYARKFQVVAMPRGNISAGENDGPAWNAGAYLYDENTDIYNYETQPINNYLQVGYGETTVFDDYYQNLPGGTFWAMNDPVVIEYEFSDGDVTYRRAIKNRIVANTLF
jgi:hypothetical protein